MNRRILLFSFAAAWLAAALPLRAQTPIYFNRFEGPDSNPRSQLYRLTANGETRIDLPLQEAAVPVKSKDGNALAVTSVDPARPNQISKNVFTLNLTNGALQMITAFRDFVDPRDNSSNTTIPIHKAFSPDGSFTAVSSIRQTTGGNRGGVSTVPLLEIYRNGGDGIAEALVHIGGIREGEFSEMLGVDWSPATGLLVTPLRVRNQGGAQPDVGALVLMRPVSDAVNSGQAQQLTFPRSGGQYGASLTWEHDMFPSFSPSSRKVAFFRSVESYDVRAGRLPSQVSLRTINSDGSGEQVIANFNPGIFPTAVSWSPDGAQLVFGLGNQNASGGFPIHEVVPSTSRLFMVPSAGGQVAEIQGTQGSGFPSWAPASSSTPSSPGNLVNISTRMRVETGENVMIGGIIVAGEGSKRVIVRAIGPSLSSVPGALKDPVLELRDSAGNLIATNDSWRSSQQDEISATGVAPPDDREAAIVATLPPGSSTAILRGAGNTTGVGVIEVYDLDATGSARLVNISTRGQVQTGDNAMIGGLIVQGDTSRRVILRAIGPSLGAQGISGALQDPTLELYDGNGAQLATNNNWRDSQQAEIEGTTIPPSDDREAAIVRTLTPGAYTAVVRGHNGTTGTGLVEVYELP